MEKFELLNIFFSGENFREILICQYIISLLLDYFFNALFYSDEIISHKYHNNGVIEFLITIILSIVSNVFSSIIIYYLKYSDRLEERLEQIHDIKNEYHYLYAFNKFLKYLKLRMICFIISEFIIICCSFYYISIFYIVYNKCHIKYHNNL